MPDPLSPEQRSLLMSKVRGKNTGPEILVRRLIFAMGYRYRLHATTLPGTPDLVFPSRRKCIFVHGCLWHRHGCALDRPPKSRRDFWEAKLQGNKERDSKRQSELRKLGWRVLVIWECQLKRSNLRSRIQRFLES
jgi:DNA mismatch endonuclease, patch repair protein